MEAKAMNGAFVVEKEGADEFGKWIYWHVPGLDNYQTFKTLPKVVEYQGVPFALTGWNSDTGTVNYREVQKLAFAK